MNIILRSKNCNFVQIISICIPLSFYLIFICFQNFTSVPLRSPDRSGLEHLLKITQLQNKEKSVILSVTVVEKDRLKRTLNNEDVNKIPPTELLANIFLKLVVFGIYY